MAISEMDRRRLALDREKLNLDRSKLEFDRQKAVYDQNFAQFRNLNDHLHRLPTLSTTLTGGLWFAAGVQPTLGPEIKFALIYVAGWFSLMLIVVMLRLRDVMDSYLKQMKAFYPPGFATGNSDNPRLRGMYGRHAMVNVFWLMSAMGVVLSWFGAFYFYWPATWTFPRWWLAGATLAKVALCSWLIMGRKPKDKRDEAII